MPPKDLVDSLLELFRILISWPVALVVVFLTFRRELRRVLPELLSRLSRRVSKASIGGTSIEFADAEAQALKDTIVKAAAEHRHDPEGLQAFLGEQLQKIVPHTTSSRPLAGKNILWVDDHPENNSYESNLFGRLGARVHPATTTSEAMQQLDHGGYDLLITDLERSQDGVEDPNAGYSIIATAASRKPPVPSIIYTTDLQRLDGTRSAAAKGCADDPRMLTDLVVRLIGRGAS